MTLPLAGIRVLDMTGNLAGPFCTQLLADFGAEIIKVEDTRIGDPTRGNPPLIGDEGANFFVVNRNKKSIRLNLRVPAGQTVFKDLAAHCDVLFETSRPGVMDKLGVGYAALREVNPRLIYCALTGYGQNGPMNQAASHDLNTLSMAGMTSLNGNDEGPPQLCAAQIGGLAGGSLYACIAILLALISREQTGQGQYCDISMMDGTFSLLSNLLGFKAGFGESTEWGTKVFSGKAAWYNIYQTKDGKYVSIGAVESKFWQQFCTRIGRPDFIPIHWEGEHQPAMKRILAEIMLTRTRDEWVAEFADLDICFTPVLSLDEVCEHPQIQARDMLFTLADFRNSGKELKLTGQPIRLSETPAELKLTFPGLGEHSDEVLAGIGYTRETIDTLRREGIIA